MEEEPSEWTCVDLCQAPSCKASEELGNTFQTWAETPTSLAQMLEKWH
jgi:hypothetical protein